VLDAVDSFLAQSAAVSYCFRGGDQSAWVTFSKVLRYHLEGEFFYAPLQIGPINTEGTSCAEILHCLETQLAIYPNPGATLSAIMAPAERDNAQSLSTGRYPAVTANKSLERRVEKVQHALQLTQRAQSTLVLIISGCHNLCGRSQYWFWAEFIPKITKIVAPCELRLFFVCETNQECSCPHLHLKSKVGANIPDNMFSLPNNLERLDVGWIESEIKDKFLDRLCVEEYRELERCVKNLLSTPAILHSCLPFVVLGIKHRIYRLNGCNSVESLIEQFPFGDFFRELACRETIPKERIDEIFIAQKTMVPMGLFDDVIEAICDSEFVCEFFNGVGINPKCEPLFSTGMTLNPTPVPSSAVRAALVTAGGRGLVRYDHLYNLQEGEFIVGRERASEIEIRDSYVSRRHFAILVDRDDVFIRDIGSANGTYINGNKVSQEFVKIDDGDCIIAGGFFCVALLGAGFSSRVNATLRDFTEVDAVTGCMKPVVFTSRLNHEVRNARVNRSELSLVVISIKKAAQYECVTPAQSVADWQGGNTGTVVPQYSGMDSVQEIFFWTVGKDIRALLRDSDFVGLMQEDLVFVVALPETGAIGAAAVASKLGVAVKRVCRQYSMSVKQFNIHSINEAFCTDDGSSFLREALLKIGMQPPLALGNTSDR
jgi:hypothetical protein